MLNDDYMRQVTDEVLNNLSAQGVLKKKINYKSKLQPADALFAPDDAGDFPNEVTLGRYLRHLLLEEFCNECLEFGNIFPREIVRLSEFQVPRHDQNLLLRVER